MRKRRGMKRARRKKKMTLISWLKMKRRIV